MQTKRAEDHGGPAAILVIGTGRSGTSLAMQALGALGISLAQDAVPASENNLRGTGEAIKVRDRIVALNQSLGGIPGHRPEGWQDHPEARKAVDWIEAYLRSERDRAGPRGFAVKFPMASIFLPLWREGAERAGISMRMIWATRDARQTVRSLCRSYDDQVEHATLVWAKRMHYVLKDADADTLLLPFEGWQTDIKAQLAILSEATGIAEPEAMQRARRQFSEILDHSADQDAMLAPGMEEIADRIDGAISGRTGRLDRIIPPDRRREFGHLLWTAIPDLLKSNARQRAARNKEEVESRIDAVSARLDEAQVAYATLCKQRDQLEEDIQNRFRHILRAAETRAAKAEAAKEKARKLNHRLKDRILRDDDQKKALKRAAEALASCRGKNEKLKADLEKKRRELKVKDGRLARVLSSRSWRFTAPLRRILRVTRA